MMQRLRERLNRPIPDTPRARRYQALLDENVAAYAEGRTEDRPDWSLAAWCWRCPLSAHYRNEKLLALAREELLKYRHYVDEDGMWTFMSSPHLHEHGWYAGAAINTLAWIYDAVSPEDREELLAGFRRAAEWYIRYDDWRRWSNQSANRVYVMYLYGLALNEPRYLEFAHDFWSEQWRTLDENGQVMEQGGPSLHYMYLTINFLNQYWYLSDDARLDEPMYRAMHWWRYMHTESLYPIQGMSTRYTRDRINHIATWAVGAMEAVAPRQPMFQKLIDRILAEVERQYGHRAACSGTLVWALLQHRGEFEPTEAHLAEWNADFDRMYRSPVTWPVIQHLLVKRRYQTGVTFVGFNPMLGLQTWAWGDEPPILQCAYECASGTSGWGFDTAQSNVSRAHITLGAGMQVPDVVYMPGDPDRDPGARAYTATHWRDFWRPGTPCYVTTRHVKFWQLYIFTPAATVIVQGGDTGPRRTRWAFHSICVPEPRVGDGVVTFEGREGRMYFLKGTPAAEVTPLGPDRHTGKEQSVRSLVFAYDGGITAFAFSDGRFRFGELDDERKTLVFSDASGTYEAAFAGLLRPAGHPHAGGLAWDAGDGFPRVRPRG